MPGKEIGAQSGASPSTSRTNQDQQPTSSNKRRIRRQNLARSLQGSGTNPQQKTYAQSVGSSDRPGARSPATTTGESKESLYFTPSSSKPRNQISSATLRSYASVTSTPMVNSPGEKTSVRLMIYDPPPTATATATSDSVADNTIDNKSSVGPDPATPSCSFRNDQVEGAESAAGSEVERLQTPHSESPGDSSEEELCLLEPATLNPDSSTSTTNQQNAQSPASSDSDPDSDSVLSSENSPTGINTTTAASPVSSLAHNTSLMINNQTVFETPPLSPLNDLTDADADNTIVSGSPVGLDHVTPVKRTPESPNTQPFTETPDSVADNTIVSGSPARLDPVTPVKISCESISRDNPQQKTYAQDIVGSSDLPVSGSPATTNSEGVVHLCSTPPRNYRSQENPAIIFSRVSLNSETQFLTATETSDPDADVTVSTADAPSLNGNLTVGRRTLPILYYTPGTLNPDSSISTNQHNAQTPASSDSYAAVVSSEKSPITQAKFLQSQSDASKPIIGMCVGFFMASLRFWLPPVLSMLLAPAALPLFLPVVMDVMFGVGALIFLISSYFYTKTGVNSDESNECINGSEQRADQLMM